MRFPRLSRRTPDARPPSGLFVLSLALTLGACAEPAAPPPLATKLDVTTPSAAIIAGSESIWHAQVNVGPVDLGPAVTTGFLKLPRFCYLTKIGGRFDLTSSLYVYTSGHPSRWYLGGSGAAGDGVRGRARCITVAAVSQTHVEDGPSSGADTLVISLSPKEWACALTGLVGNDYPQDTYVELRGDLYDASLNSWQLVVYGKDTYAWARCFKPLPGWSVRSLRWWQNGDAPQLLRPHATSACWLGGVADLNDPSENVYVGKGATKWELSGGSPSPNFWSLWALSYCVS